MNNLKWVKVQFYTTFYVENIHCARMLRNWISLGYRLLIRIKDIKHFYALARLLQYWAEGITHLKYRGINKYLVLFCSEITFYCRNCIALSFPCPMLTNAWFALPHVTYSIKGKEKRGTRWKLFLVGWEKTPINLLLCLL